MVQGSESDTFVSELLLEEFRKSDALVHSEAMPEPACMQAGGACLAWPGSMPLSLGVSHLVLHGWCAGQPSSQWMRPRQPACKPRHACWGSCQAQHACAACVQPWHARRAMLPLANTRRPDRPMGTTTIAGPA